VRRIVSGACELYEIGAPAMSSMMQAMLAAPGIIGARQPARGSGLHGGVRGSGRGGSVCERGANQLRAATKRQPEIYAVRAAAGRGSFRTREPGRMTCGEKAGGRVADSSAAATARDSNQRTEAYCSYVG